MKLEWHNLGTVPKYHGEALLKELRGRFKRCFFKIGRTGELRAASLHACRKGRKLVSSASAFSRGWIFGALTVCNLRQK